MMFVFPFMRKSGLHVLRQCRRQQCFSFDGVLAMLDRAAYLHVWTFERRIHNSKGYA